MEFPGIAHFDPNVASASDEILLYSEGNVQYPVVQAEGYDIPAPQYVPADDQYNVYANAEFHETHSILADGGDRFGVSAIAFDHQEELLWMGNQGGHVTSYYGPGMQKYTSFQVHANQEVRHIHTFDEGILALTTTSLRCQIRRGIPVFTYSSVHMEDMQCQLQLSQDTVLMGGHQEKIIEFNLPRRQEIKLHQVGKNGCAILRQSGRFICAGDPSGRIDLRDPNTLSVEHSLDAHSGSLSDFDVHGNLLVTCGFSNRQCGLSVDRFLMVYDLRMLRALAPLPVVVDPLLLRFLPSFSSRLATVSALGQLQLLDTVALDSSGLSLYQVDTAGSMCLAFDVSSSCQCVALGDAGGSIHLLVSGPVSAASTAPVFNTFSRETEFADPVDPLPPIGFTDDAPPLSTVPLPYTQPGTTLLSDWPPQFLQKVYRRTPPINPEILRTMKMQGTIGYAPNPMSSRRNQVAYKAERTSGQVQRKLFSDSRPGAGEVGFIAIPKRYRKTDVRYSRMGASDFNFEQYNGTGLCGLEATLANSYCNAMIQVLYYTESVHNLLLSHLCCKEFCLSCELGFLFHMLDNSQGLPCQSNNFLRAFRTVPEASALGLILSDRNPEARRRANLISLIQNWNQFILHQMHSELLETRRRQEEAENSRQPDFVYNELDFPSILGSAQLRLSKNRHDRQQEGGTQASSKQCTTEDMQPEETEISLLFGTRQMNTHICMTCNSEVSKESIVLLTNLIYPHNSSDNQAEYTFCDVLMRSMFPEQTTPAWCEHCGRYRQSVRSRKITALPQIMAVNCGLDHPQNKQFWQQQIELATGQRTSCSPGETKDGEAARKLRMCRYGTGCTRPSCRFSHSTMSSPPVTTKDTTTPLAAVRPWLPAHLTAKLRKDGDIDIQGFASPTTQLEDEYEEIVQTVNYDLTAVVCHVSESRHPERNNLVALINVPSSYHKKTTSSCDSQWYIFNDFTVTPVPGSEAVWFSLDWKLPCVLFFTNRNLPSELVPPPLNPLTADVFREDESLARGCGQRMITFTPLGTNEMLGRGDIVAMDAEFVTLNQEESELRSDGKMSTIKPSQMSVARITCIRGQGPLEGTPFIDDYISTQEQVVDYLTKFSGIKPGDLDANFSSKHLTTLKSTYQKLRFLVDIGVKFVGHGLKNDFRVINLVVPAEQIIDTVSLFHLPHHRMVSLRFLAWHFLGINIQSETHDSVEDARTALHLYQHYCHLEAKGASAVRAALEELYNAGNRLHWQVPCGLNDSNSSGVSVTSHG
ncbi:PAN2-PAN3 deadenylation complex catalytic subunit PAN2 [Schistocerca gregaria]|uniref:PAN2-PAN3 deadenylation complex catalytic subunit PAN2 n=1 Tax=Schistocerca gregaria TaxID=7010 RepID=UPI00211DCDDB|nr:PAN2-PAN3 deadenylation complex catalytic subunit PAN2 [Schistocerca gregaria]